VKGRKGERGGGGEVHRSWATKCLCTFVHGGKKGEKGGELIIKTKTEGVFHARERYQRERDKVHMHDPHWSLLFAKMTAKGGKRGAMKKG